MNYERAVINFDHKCSLSCPFCYVPFQSEAIDFNKFKSVIKECSEIGFRVITFAGGDPFDHPHFRDILLYTYKLGFEIHIDTNGIGLAEADYELIEGTTSILSLPIDGPNEAIHDQIRCTKGHYDLIVEHIKKLERFNLKLKINTVVLKTNLHSINEIGNVLSGMGISIWSVYQFMSLANAYKYKKQFHVTNDEFDNLIYKLKSNTVNFKLEIGKDVERRKSYLFIAPSGKIYTHNPLDYRTYQFLGNIFDSQWEEKFWQLNSSTIRDESRHRYSILSDESKI